MTTKAQRGSLAFLVALVVIAAALASWVGLSVMGGRDKASHAEDAAAVQLPVVEDAAADGSGTGEGEDGSGEAPDAGSDSRSTEFAVDSARADWNFDEPETKTVYLTFDDGPSANTATVLDILDRYDIKATFFVTNINPDYADMIAECHRRGHTIGMHTYTHDYAQVYASVDAYWNDLGQISHLVEEQIGYVPCFIRFPGGSSNTVSANYTAGIMTTLSQQVVDAGYQYYDWDASCGDGAVHTADELVEATKADTSYGPQSIVFLAHDGADKETTAEALPRIIEYFQEQGYSFAPIDRQSRVVHHGIGN